jgi:transcriptional regulator with XRE-family HTH domain
MNKLNDAAPINGSEKIESLHLVHIQNVGQEKAEERVTRLYKSPGGPLVAWLFDEAKSRGHNQKEIATELGITYGYLSQLQNGTRNSADIGQSIVDACAKYLGVPGVVVKIISGNIKISEFVLPYQNEEQVIDRAIRKVQSDPQIRSVLPDDLLSLPLAAKKAIILMYSEAAGHDIFGYRELPDVVRLLQRAAMYHEENEATALYD